MSFYKKKDLAEIDFSDIDDLLSQLTPDEAEKLSDELCHNPDDSQIPPYARCRDQTKKQPTGPYNRDNLIKFLEDQSKSEIDWEQNKPYVREIKGKVWQPPPKPEKIETEGQSEEISTEWDEALAGASEADIVELAAILGYTGLVNQIQFYAAQKKYGGEAHIDVGGWRAVAKSAALKILPLEPDNSTDVDESISKLRDNDPSLVDLNLNNIKNISYEKMNHIIDAMKENTNLKTLSMCNIDMPDSVAKNLVEMLEENKDLLTLNIESNLLTGLVVADICRATLKNQTLVDLRLSNQRAQILGNKVEMDIAKIVSQNNTLLRLGIHFDTLGPRVTVQETLKKNWDKLRLKRLNSETNEDT